MGELHLEVLVDRMLREFKVQANVGRPQVSYREAIRRAVPKAEGRFVRQTGGKGQYGHAVLTLEPLERGAGFEWESKIVGGAVPREYWRAIEEGVKEALAGGVVAGYPVIDVKATLVDGSFHEVDSLGDGVQDRRQHGRQGRRRQGRPGDPRAGHEGRGDDARGVHGGRHRQPQQQARPDRRDRRARLEPHRSRSHVPLAEMFGYATELRSMTQGRATYSMEFGRYAEVPSQPRHRAHCQVQELTDR